MTTYIDKDDLPIGWGYIVEALNDDIQRMVDKGKVKSFEAFEVKEKYGDMRVYYDAETDNANTDQELSDMIECYSAISADTCIYCGTFPVFTIEAGWVSPVCENCYVDQRYCMKPYDQVKKSTPNPETYITMRRYSSDYGAIDRKLDLRPYIKRIAERRAKHAVQSR